jgi:hypothetical protein
VWLDFLTRAVCSGANWLPVGEAREVHRAAALAHWYGAKGPA